MKKSVTAAVIGYGGMGSRHVKQMSQVPGIRMKGAYDILPEKQKQIREDGFEAYPDLESLLADKEVELVVIATPNQEHMIQSVRALQAGKHVICEKPVTVSVQNLEQIIRVKESTGKQFFVHQNRRWDEDYAAVKKCLDSGKLGRVYHIESRVMGARGVPNDWRRISACGGGMLLDWGVHLIDQMLCLVPGKLVRLACRLSYQQGLEVDDGFTIFLEFDSGVTAVLQAATWNFETLPRWYVNGTEGTLRIDRWHDNGTVTCLKKALEKDAVPVVTAAGITKTMAPRDPDSVRQEKLMLEEGTPFAFYENVRRVLTEGDSPAVTVPQVLRCMKVIEAAMRSAQLESPVTVEP